jgi:hypothetical protein
MPRAGTSPVAPPHHEHRLQVVTPEALADAQHWVSTWPAARGGTKLFPALRLSSSTWGHTDDVYLFSDGLVDDPAVALAFLEAALAKGENVPRFNCIAFFARDVPTTGSHRGKAFLQALATLTHGTFREFNANVCQVCIAADEASFVLSPKTVVMHELAAGEGDLWRKLSKGTFVLTSASASWSESKKKILSSSLSYSCQSKAEGHLPQQAMCM